MIFSEKALAAIKERLDKGNHNFKEVILESVVFDGETIYEDVVYRNESNKDGVSTTITCLTLMGNVPEDR